MKHELRALTSMRGIAAWLVVFYHIRFSIAGLTPGAAVFLGKGYLAVDFFFLLSGFVIWLTWAQRIRDERWSIVPLFLQKRVARIWPLHLVMLVFAVVMALTLKIAGHPDDAAFPFADLPYHILLIQNWRGYGSLAWNDPAWSISAELFAYLMFPLVALTVDWRKLPSAVVIGAGAAILAAMAAFMASRGLHALGDDIPQFGLVRCISEFICGTAVGALWLRWKDRSARPALGAAAIACVALALYLPGIASELIAVPVAFAAALLVLALTSDMAGNPMAARPIHYLGEISYATYLSHSLVWKAYKLAFVADAGAVPPYQIALFLVIVLALSVLLYHGVERPAQHWINRVGDRIRRRGGDQRVAATTQQISR